jgi:hypothetical protein
MVLKKKEKKDQLKKKKLEPTFKNMYGCIMCEHPKRYLILNYDIFLSIQKIKKKPPRPLLKSKWKSI